MKKREKLAKKLIVAAIAVTVAFSIAEGASIVTGPARADQEDIGSFDPIYYAALYPDVAAAVGSDAEALYNHYVSFGQAEGRIPYAGAEPGAAVDGAADTAAVTPSVPAPSSGVATHSWDEARQLWYQGLPHGYQPDYSRYRYTPEQMALLAQKQKEFDEGGYVHVGWTEEQVYQRLMELKEKYPEGTRVGHCDAGAGYIYSGLYGSAMNFGCGWDIDADQWYDAERRELLPAGFVFPVKAHPNGRAADINTLSGSLKDRLRVGDVIYTINAKRTGHVAVVLSHNDRGITVVESNLNSDERMHWGRFISWKELDDGRNSHHDGACTDIEHYLY